MRSALAFLTLVTMATAINLRKQFRPVNDDRADYQVPNKLTNSYLSYDNCRNSRALIG